MPRRRPLMDGDPDSAFDPPTRQEKFDSAPYTDPPPLGGDDLLRQIEQDRQGGAFDNPIAGSPESPRDIFRSPGPRTIFEKPPAGPPLDGGTVLGPDPETESGPLDDILSMLPQGVEATADPGSVSTPMQSATPQSVSMRGLPPASVGPKRQSVSSPMQFGGGGGRSLIGRGAGQFGGGIGMPGGPSGGPRPTEQMLALLRQLGIA